MLEGLDQSKVFYYFEEISKIPRGSGNNTKISNYLVEFAKSHGLAYRQDACENVIIWKQGSKGYEDKPAVMLQGHMDMVCEKEVDCDHDFEQQPLDLQIDGDYIYAKGTTLGGDDGIALAYAMAILDDESLVHPPIEAVFTTDEETGMDGAIGLDTSDLKAKYLVNIDSEEEGCILTSCAGGMSVNATFEFQRVKKSGDVITISVDGLQGGHSGTEIDKNRENAVLLLGRIMTELTVENVEFALVEMNGGLKDNAIPRNAEMKIVVESEDQVVDCLKKIIQKLTKEVSASEPKALIQASCDKNQEVEAVEEDVTKKISFFLEQAPNGVQKMSASLPGLVESSLNLGICKCSEKNVFFSFSVRSSLQSYKDYLGTKLQHLITNLGGKFALKSQYPAWEYRADSKLRDILTRVYEEQYGELPRIEAIHAGLECGILSSKMPEFDMVSIGPDILDIHTPKERLVISSTKRVYAFVVRALEEMCKH